MTEVVVVSIRQNGSATRVERFQPVYRALNNGEVELVGDSAPGCRVSVRIPAELLEDVPSAEPPVDEDERARAAEDRVLAALLARAQLGI